MLIEKEMDSLMDCQRLPFMPDTPDDDLVLLHQYHVSETYPMHSHEFYEIFYVVKGQALHQINGSSQIVTEGSLVFIRPDDVHCYQLLNFSDFEFINVNISLALTAQAFLWMRIPVESATDPALPPSIKLTGPAHLEMRRRFTELSQMPSGPSRRRTFCALLPELLLLGLGRRQLVLHPPDLPAQCQKQRQDHKTHGKSGRHFALFSGSRHAASPLCAAACGPQRRFSLL